MNRICISQFERLKIAIPCSRSVPAVRLASNTIGSDKMSDPMDYLKFNLSTLYTPSLAFERNLPGNGWYGSNLIGLRRSQEEIKMPLFGNSKGQHHEIHISST